MRAGLHGHPDAVGPRAPQQGQRPGVGQVDDVHPGAGVGGRGEQPGDGGLLGGRWAGGEETGVAAAGGVGSGLDGGLVLAVRDEQAVDGGELGEHRAQAGVVQRRELGDAAVEQEALEPDHAGVEHRPQLTGVPGHRAAPERDVDRHLAGRRGPFRGEPSRVVVGGIEFSGMSTTVVMPPAAAALVALAKPSHSVRRVR